MKFSWWIGAILSSIVFIFLIGPSYNLLNDLTDYNPQSYDFGGSNLAWAPLVAFIIANIVNFFVSKNKKIYSFGLFWLISSILLYSLLFPSPFSFLFSWIPLPFLEWFNIKLIRKTLIFLPLSSFLHRGLPWNLFYFQVAWSWWWLGTSCCRRCWDGGQGRPGLHQLFDNPFE